MIISLVGSTKYKDIFLEKAKEFELNGDVVLCTHLFSHTDGYELNDEQLKNAVENGHKRIDMSEMVYVIAPNNYIGESTREEIEYAKRKGKIIQIWTGDINLL